MVIREQVCDDSTEALSKSVTMGRWSVESFAEDYLLLIRFVLMNTLIKGFMQLQTFFILHLCSIKKQNIVK